MTLTSSRACLRSTKRTSSFVARLTATLAAVLCCAITATVFTACEKDDEFETTDFVGTWTDSNDLYTDVLTMNEDGTFRFRSHIPMYNDAGNYRYEFKVVGFFADYHAGKEHYLTFNFNNKEAQTLHIDKLDGGNCFRASKCPSS